MSKNIEEKKAETVQEKMDKVKKHFGTFFYKPFNWQKRALEVVRKKNTTAIICSNKIGKCLTFDSLIDTPDGEISIGSLYRKGQSFRVYAWDGEKKVIAKAHAPFKKKGLHECYRLIMSDGRWIEAADYHRILTVCGWKSILDVLLPYSQNPQKSSWGISPSIHVSSVRHLTQKQLDCQGDYWMDSYRDGVQPLLSPDTGKVLSQLQHGFLKYNPYGLNLGVLVERCKHILLSQYNDLLCMGSQFGGLISEFLNRIFYTNYLQCSYEHPAFLQSSYAGASCFLPIPSTVSQPHDTVPSYNPPLYVCGNKIVSYEFIGSQDVYDFEVEKYHNYFAGGLIHHNTTTGANIVISWALGYEPWSVVDKDHPEAIGVGGLYYRKSSLGIKPPVNIIITGEDWKLHIGRTLVPELKKWAPAGWYETKKNEQGVEFLWTWNNGSTFTIMCYTQDDDLFESFRAQGCLMDEPPPRSKYTAMSRGLLLDCGKTLLTLTPLKEAWILDDLVLSGRKDVGVVDSLGITENPMLFNSDIRALQGFGFNEKTIREYFNLLLYDDAEKKIPVSDKGHRAEKFLLDRIPIDKQEEIAKLRILKFIKDIDPDDVPPRVFGHFKSLVGRVLKEFNDNIHVIEPFKAPTDWVITPMIDFHLSKPQAVSYWAVNKQEIHYCIAEVWQNISADEIADDIIRRKLAGWRIEDAFIDPLSKGDTAYVKNMLGTNVQDSFSIIHDKLSHHGMTLHVATKDKDSGIKNIQSWLKGVNGLPTCYIFNTCERHLFEVKRWVFDEDMKPAKENDHFMENWYRYTLTGASYSNYDIKPLPTMTNDNYFGYAQLNSSWMSA